MTLAVALFIAMCVAQAADVYTTLRAIKAGAVEGNPAMVKLLGKRPKAAGLLAVKIAVCAWIGYELNVVGWQADNAYLMATATVTLFLTAVAVNNLRIARKLEAKR